MDHPYKVFFPNYEMQHEVAVRLATLFNQTGIGHFDFDGHEGGWASGQGDFGVEMFAKVLYDHLQQPLHNGTSNIRPFYWHINTCCNWGEPWYGGFRSSMADYRINNQAMLQRNFMPCMLGWFLMTPDTTLADIEWLMARSAGYNSGFALATSLQAVRTNPLTGKLLDAIRQWEGLRMADAFDDDQRRRMRDSDQEFHLEKAEDGHFQLFMYQRSQTYTHQPIVRQPGEPTAAQWEYTNPGAKQPLQFALEVDGEGADVKAAVMEVDGYLRLEIPLAINQGQALVCDGTKTLRLYGPQGQLIQKVALPTEPPALSSGAHRVEFSCEFSGQTSPRARPLQGSWRRGTIAPRALNNPALPGS